MATTHVLEHRTTLAGRWLRARRFKLALLIGAGEALYVIFSDRGWLWALVVAALLIGFWWFIGRAAAHDWLREGSWTLAAAQLVVLVVPLVALALATVVVVATVALIAVIFLMLFLDRR